MEPRRAGAQARKERGQAEATPQGARVVRCQMLVANGSFHGLARSEGTIAVRCQGRGGGASCWRCLGRGGEGGEGGRDGHGGCYGHEGRDLKDRGGSDGGPEGRGCEDVACHGWRTKQDLGQKQNRVISRQAVGLWGSLAEIWTDVAEIRPNTVFG